MQPFYKQLELFLGGMPMEQEIHFDYACRSHSARFLPITMNGNIKSRNIAENSWKTRDTINGSRGLHHYMKNSGLAGADKGL